MATQTKTEPKKSDDPLFTTPIVIAKSKKKGKKKKKYTKGTKGIQRLALGLNDALYRSANSVAKAGKTISKRTKKSSRKKKDGLVRDSLRNVSRGVSDGFTELGKAPNEVARRIGTGQVRRAFKVITPIIPFGR